LRPQSLNLGEQAAHSHDEMCRNFKTQLEVFEKTMENDRRDSISQIVLSYADSDDLPSEDVDLNDPSSMWDFLNDECMSSGLRPQLSRMIQALLRLPVDNFWGDVCWDVACASINEISNGQSYHFLKDVKSEGEVIKDRLGNKCAPVRLDLETYGVFMERKKEAISRVAFADDHHNAMLQLQEDLAAEKRKSDSISEHQYALGKEHGATSAKAAIEAEVATKPDAQTANAEVVASLENELEKLRQELAQLKEDQAETITAAAAAAAAAATAASAGNTGGTAASATTTGGVAEEAGNPLMAALKARGGGRGGGLMDAIASRGGNAGVGGGKGNLMAALASRGGGGRGKGGGGLMAAIAARGDGDGASKPAAAAGAGDEDVTAKYRKMQKMGLPEGAIRQKMMKDGLSDADQEQFFNPAPQGPDMSKYEKMQKMHLPEGAIRNKMTKDGLSAAEQEAFFNGGAAESFLHLPSFLPSFIFLLASSFLLSPFCLPSFLPSFLLSSSFLQVAMRRRHPPLWISKSTKKCKRWFVLKLLLLCRYFVLKLFLLF
jgi:hypothetical protein